MGSIAVDQVQLDGSVIEAPDRTLTETEKNDLLLRELPGAALETMNGLRVVRWGNQVLLKKQITHLGNPWPGFKKRIQIPRSWVDVYSTARAAGLVTRFIGIYHHADVTIFVDFDPQTYVLRKANNSAAHVSTNDLFQAQTLGVFSRQDRRGNVLTSIRSGELAGSLQGASARRNPRLEVFGRFNHEFMTAQRLEALDAIKQMHEARWPDRFQGEWPGFYLEYRLDEFLRREGLTDLVEFQKVKGAGYDYDLVFRTAAGVGFYGDLKASDSARSEAPGNDADDLTRCVRDFGKFWYVIYEHETWHARDNGNRATVEWNQWRRSVGFVAKKGFNPLSYARKFKEAVRFQRMSILEVNAANYHVALGGFPQGQQPDGAARALKVMIKKRNIDNFLIYSTSSS